MNTTGPLVYFILGTPGSGRRTLVLDLVENGLGENDPVLVLVAEGEADAPEMAKLAARPHTEVRRWTWTPPELPDQALPAGGTVFFLADGRTDPISQIEALKMWLFRNGAELGRIFTTVDCQLAERHPPLRQWFEALIHFSDVVLLTKREGVPNKWLSDFIGYFEAQFFPCHFLHAKKGGLANPAIVLDPLARRVSQYFEETGELISLDPDLVIETEDGEEIDEDDEEVDEDAIPPEPYFVRDRRGRRERELPDISKFLPPAV